MPACLEVCPVGARKFGNVLDPESEVSQLLKSKRVFVLKEDVGTLPRFFYYFDERYPRTQMVSEPVRFDEGLDPGQAPDPSGEEQR